MTQRQPTLLAAAASARPWLPSVALITTQSLSCAACLPVSRSAGKKPEAGQWRRSSRNSATGAPSTLKLARGDRLDSSFRLICASPSCRARPASAHTGEGLLNCSGQHLSQRRLSAALSILSS